MKKFAIALTAAAIALTGCASNNLNDTRVMTLEGQTKEVKIIDIPSFQVEIAPRKAVCELTSTTDTKVAGECLQYRRTIDRNFNVRSGDIEGFEYEEGFRYVLDVKQTSVTEGDNVKPVWTLNKLISKTPEITN